MPVYNGLPYLRQAIESVLNQTFPDFEFLIIDDASTDDSVACIRSYRDPRIRLVCNVENVGQTRSLNKGLELARGTFIARLDQDDVCLPERLQKQVAFLEERPEVAAACSWEYSIDSQGRKIRSWRRRLEDYGAFLGYSLVAKCPIWHPSAIFHRRVVVDLGGYDESYAPADDFDLWIRIAMHRYTAAIVPEFLVLQRVHGGRQSVNRATVQLEKARQAHSQLVRAYCNASEADLVAVLLRMDEIFWTQCKSKRQLKAALNALSEMLTNIQTALGLSPAEFISLKRVVYGRLGLGVKLGRGLAWLPSVLFYPLFLSLSPMLVPQIRRVVSSLYSKLYTLQYPIRLLPDIVQRLVPNKRT
jgi:glycosyltransferase involved in cell wall biosynthesis